MLLSSSSSSELLLTNLTYTQLYSTSTQEKNTRLCENESVSLFMSNWWYQPGLNSDATLQSYNNEMYECGDGLQFMSPIIWTKINAALTIKQHLLHSFRRTHNLNTSLYEPLNNECNESDQLVLT